MGSPGEQEKAERDLRATVRQTSGRGLLGWGCHEPEKGGRRRVTQEGVEGDEQEGGGMDRGPHSSTGCSVNKAKNDAILAWLQLRL